MLKLLKNEKRWIRVSVLCTLAIALILSIFIVLKYNNYFLLGSIEKMNNDDVKYVRSGETLLKTGMLTYHSTDAATVFIMPGITFVLAFFIKLFGFMGSMTAFRILQCILFVIGLLLIFLIGRSLFNSSVGAVACILDALYLPEYSNNGLILTEGIFRFLLLWLLYVTIRAVQTEKVSLYLLGGGIWGLACLFRPTIALYPAAVLLVWLVKKYSVRKIIKFAIPTIAVFVVIMSPWWIRNYVEFHRFIPLTVSSGNPMLQGTYIGYSARLQDPNYLEAQKYGDKTQVELAKKRIVENFSKEPLKYALWYTFGKTACYWGDAYYWRPVLGIGIWPARVIHYFILISAIIGMVISLKRSKESFLLFGTVLYFNVAHLPYITASRYSFPVMPLMIIFAAYTVCRVRKLGAQEELLSNE